MQSLQFVLLIFWLEACFLLREVTCDVLIPWVSCEHAAVAAMALYPCQAHRFVRRLSKEADFNARVLTKSVWQNFFFGVLTSSRLGHTFIQWVLFQEYSGQSVKLVKNDIYGTGKE
jgi:hypothetical protein